ncbi:MULTISPECIES: CheW domain-containing protein [unclassified Pseudomonas]|uniref:CheW domain-containing protein n=1 Tax=unclassified Pseudomonas TaxID=196821 RepID=UPI0025FB1751|nr:MULTISPECIES: chemotaxis protein CheW [unclassified Pseudomonas]
MNRPLDIATRPQLALQNYLDALLQDATEELEVVQSIDDFQAAVLEEQAHDARMHAAAVSAPVNRPAPVPLAYEPQPAPVREAQPEPRPFAEPVVETVVARMLEQPVTLPQVIAPAVAPAVVEPVADVYLPTQRTPTPPPTADARPDWAAEPFECLLFDVAGLTLAVPLVCLGSIYPLAGHDLTPLFGQPDWFLGILPSQAGNLKVLDTARWIMPDRYRDDFRQGLQYVISVQGYEWGLAVHQVSRSLRLSPDEIKWRTHRGQRPWLAGTVIEHMCALLDVSELAELIASGAVKQMQARN